ncbi:hypothetical protein UPYG_G00065930 [Umbra pygmaea]|uniref:Uncharacterized protein n=1 Tax=Umbra pygmaea TaxID=75934 RepID=A0ABD0XAE6_UMBPY
MNIWRDAIFNNYKYVTREVIGHGGLLIICKNENLDVDNQVITVSYFTRRTILVQGNEDSINTFEEIPPLLKQQVMKDKFTATTWKIQVENWQRIPKYQRFLSPHQPQMYQRSLPAYRSPAQTRHPEPSVHRPLPAS